MPSAAVLARDFNFRSQALEPITAETARRWVRGLSMPGFDRLRILIDWLEMNPNFLGVGQNGIGGSGYTETKGKDGSLPDSLRINGSGAVLSRELSADEAELLHLYRKSNQKLKRLLLSVAHALVAPSPNE